MKRYYLVTLALAIVLAACGGKKTPDVKFETKTIFSTNPNDTLSLSSIDIQRLQVADAPDELKQQIDGATDSWIKSFLTEDLSSTAPIIDLVNNKVEAIKKTMVDDTLRYSLGIPIFELTIYPDTVYQNKDVLSIRYNSFVYTGGAHGLDGVTCWNYNKHTNKPISYTDLVVDEAKLLSVAEQQFRQDQGLDADQPLDEEYFFDKGVFALGKQFAFTNEGITFFYQPYEVAPYALGIIELKLPSSKIRGLVNFVKK